MALGRLDLSTFERHYCWNLLTALPTAQPLSLLLKACPIVDELALYDVVNTPGVTADLSHISSIAKIKGYLPKDDGLQHALTGADVILIPAGIPRIAIE